MSNAINPLDDDRVTNFKSGYGNLPPSMKQYIRDVLIECKNIRAITIDGDVPEVSIRSDTNYDPDIMNLVPENGKVLYSGPSGYNTHGLIVGLMDHDESDYPR